MTRCKHEPVKLFDEPTHLASALLRPHRAHDWRRCTKCGKVGLASRHTGRVHSWCDRDVYIERRASEYNVWNAKITADEAARNSVNSRNSVT